MSAIRQSIATREWQQCQREQPLLLSHAQRQPFARVRFVRTRPRFSHHEFKSVAAKFGPETLGHLRAFLGRFAYLRDAGGGAEIAKARGIAAFHAAVSVTRNGGSKGGGPNRNRTGLPGSIIKLLNQRVMLQSAGRARNDMTNLDSIIPRSADGRRVVP